MFRCVKLTPFKEKKSVNTFGNKSNYWSNNTHRVTLVEGDGIGPEVIDSVVGVFAAAQTPIVWERLQHIKVRLHH